RAVRGRNVHDTFGIDVESSFNLWHTARRRSNTGQLEIAQWFVICGEFAFTLEYLNVDRWLVIVCGRKGFRTLRWDSRVPFNQFGHHTALGFNTQRQRGDVDQEHILALTCQHTGLDSSTNGDNLIRVDTTVWFLATGKFFDRFSNVWHTG